MLKKVVGYAAVMFGASTVFSLLNFLVNVLGAVSREKSTFGDYVTYQLIYSSAQCFFIFGVNAVVQKYGAASDEHRKDFSALALRLFVLLVLVSAVAAALLSPWFDSSVLLGILAIPFTVSWWWGRYLTRSRLEAAREAILTGLPSLSMTVIQFVLVTFTGLEHALIYGDFAAVCLGGLAALLSLPRIAQISPLGLWRRRVPRDFMREAFRFGVPLWWAGQVEAAKESAGRYLVRADLGAAAMAAVGFSQTLWQFAAKPAEFISQAALPALVTARDERKSLYRDLSRLCLVTIPGVGLAVATGIPILLLLIDTVSQALGHTGEPMASKYREVPSLLFVMAFALPWGSFTMVWNQFVVAEGQSRAPLWAQSANAIVVLASLYPLSQAFGLQGVLASGVLGQIAAAGTYALRMRAAFPEEVSFGVRHTLVTAAVHGACLVGAQAIHDLPWGWTAAFLAVPGFAVGLLLGGVLKPSDLTRTWRAFRRRRQAKA